MKYLVSVFPVLLFESQVATKTKYAFRRIFLVFTRLLVLKSEFYIFTKKLQIT